MECEQNCCRCRRFDCQKHCKKYVSRACHKFDRAPYVCNNCPEKKLCVKDKYIYSAKHADAAVSRRRSESRKGVRITDVQKAEMDELITKLVKKGQPLTHIYAERQAINNGRKVANLHLDLQTWSFVSVEHMQILNMQ